MSKKKAPQQNHSFDELMLNGTTTLTADSRKDIYEMSASLVGLIPEEVRWTRTVVEYKENAFTQTFTLIKTD